MKTQKPPFLAREAFYWLTLAAPLITLLIAQIGSTAPTLERAAGCLLSTWFCTVIGGFSVHVVINWAAPRLFASQSRVAAYAILAGIGVATVVASMSLLLPRLVWLDVNLAGPSAPFILRALGVAAIYVIAARLTTWLSTRARSESERAKESESRALRARLAALQAQVNPHFLFNTLNAIASLIPTDPELAETTIERLAGVLQYSIAAGTRGSVTIGEELAAVSDYLDIEQARFGSRLRSTIEVDADLRAQTFPPMLLQPLVENAVLHGLSEKQGGGAIEVSGRSDANDVVITVSDDGVGPGNSKRRGNNTGLDNLRERLALTYGTAARFETRARVGGGFECELRVPRTASA